MKSFLNYIPRFSLLITILVLLGCQPKAPDGTTSTDSESGDVESTTRDLLRVSVLSWDGYESLPKQGLAPENYRDLIQKFAQENDYDLQWRRLERFNELLTSIRNGASDVAVSHITITESRERIVDFTIPITTSRIWLVGVRDDGRLGVARETAYVDVAHNEYPETEVILLEAGTNPEEVAEAIAAGKFERSLMDEAVARSILEDHPKLKKLKELNASWNYGWAVNSDKPEIKTQLDDFIRRERLESSQPPTKRTWAEIKTVGTLRMITVNGPTTFYLWRGEFVGYEYDLMLLFAKSHGLKLDPIVAGGVDEVLQFLQEGKGDVVSASLTPTVTRRSMGLLFSNTYLPVWETVVSRDQPINRVEDLQGKIVHVNPATSFYEHLQDLKRRADFDIALREGVSTEHLVEEVSAGDIEVTVADSHMFAAKAAFNESIKSGLNIGTDHGLSWVVRDDQAELLQKLNEWIKKNYRGLEYNLAGSKYFEVHKQLREFEQHRIRADVLSPFDRITKPIAARYQFDWRLITSQMFEESKFKSQAESYAGALGLLQIMPNTALEMNVDPDELSNPRIGIETGVKYLDWTRRRFQSLDPLEQQWFALAAYNAGVGHVRDAQKLSEKLGLDENKWFDNVEHAMLHLSEPEYYRNAHHGYVRGREPIRYVRNIRDRYEVYLAHFEDIESR